jgi:signal transduction histidine kinase
MPVVDPDALRQALKPEHRALAERVFIYSLMVVPLRARGRVVGTLNVARDRPGQPYTADDLALLEGLADRAAVAIEGMRLYRAEQRARAEAQAAVATRDQFLSTASHELRTPVTVIKGYAQAILRAERAGRLDPVRLRHELTTIVRGADRLDRLVQDLLDVSRLRTGQLTLQLEPVNLGELARDVMARYLLAADSRHRITTDAPEQPLLAAADPVRLEQVLTNVLENAVKYTPDGGEVVVQVQPDGAGHRVTVRDSGIGLPAGSEDAIFEPFGRAPNARFLPGMGMGLYISRGIIRQHGGRMWAESAGQGCGTAVSFWLPASAPAPSAAPVDPATSAAPAPPATPPSQ